MPVSRLSSLSFFGLRLARSVFSASISASLAYPFRSAPGSGAALVPAPPGCAWNSLAGSASTSAFKAATRALAAASASSRRKRALVRALARRSLDLGAIDHDLVGVKKVPPP